MAADFYFVDAATSYPGRNHQYAIKSMDGRILFTHVGDGTEKFPLNVALSICDELNAAREAGAKAREGVR